MTKESSEEKATQEPSKESAYERLLKKGRKVPHPGTVRVTIFENPRTK